MKYSIDTSSLINPWYKMYPRDIFPSFWNCFEALCKSGDIAACEAVSRELEIQDGDELNEWCKSMPSFRCPLDSEVQVAVKKIMAECNIVNIKKNRSGADVFVVAFAMVKGLTVVSQEEPRKQDSALMKIPDACAYLGIRHISITDLIREQGWRF